MRAALGMVAKMFKGVVGLKIQPPKLIQTLVQESPLKDLRWGSLIMAYIESGYFNLTKGFQVQAHSISWKSLLP